MRRATGSAPWRAGRLIVVSALVAASFAWSISLACAEEDGSGDEKLDDAAWVLPPEAEPKFAELIKRISEAKRKVWVERMNKGVEEVVKVTGADADIAKKLEAEANQAIGRALETWTPKMSSFLRRSYVEQAEQIVEMLDEILGQAESFARQDFVTDFVPPIEDPRWVAAIEQTLTPAQAATWKKAQEERRNVVGKEIKQFLTPSVERNREQFATMMRARTSEIQLVLELPKERADQLEKIAGEAATKSAEAWRVRAEKVLLAADDESRRQMTKSGMFYLAPDRSDLPHLQATWKEGLAKFLLPEEKSRLENAADEKKARRVVALGRVMIAELDQRMAFTGPQREKLRPITERLVKGQRALFPDGGFNQYVNFSPQTFFLAGAKATEEELKPILDAAQWKRWQELCSMKRPVRSSSALAPAKPSTHIPEPEEIEHKISDHLYEKAGKERAQILGALRLKIEDAGRVAGLRPETVARLETAARGTAEEMLTSWKSSMEQTIRAQVRDGTPQTVMQRLAGMGNYETSRGRVIPEQKGMWAKTLKTELSDAQRAAWDQEIAQRNAFRDQAIIAAVMAEFDRSNTLTSAQWTALEPIVAGIIKEYSQEIGGMFSPSNSIPWYLQYYTTLIPFVGIPENEMKTILRKEQWERWIASGEYSNCKNYWENIQSNHAQRVKAKKP